MTSSDNLNNTSIDCKFTKDYLRNVFRVLHVTDVTIKKQGDMEEADILKL